MRPYGKIEDGLPRWHVEQRKQEYKRIDGRMKKENVYFVPCTKLGRDFGLAQLFEWGFSAVILGEWRLARPRIGCAGSGAVRRQGPRIPESVYLLVQPQERKGLQRAAL